MFTIGMLAILAVAGLALDTSHAMLNKTRLQNTVDAAALAAAHVLDNTTDVILAEQAARDVFAANQAAAGNGELATNADAGLAIVEFSSTLEPFAPGTTPAQFVRVTYNGYTIPAWLIQVLGIDSKRISASAVSGPSPVLGAACDVVPLIICGDPDAGGPYWGYEKAEVVVLKGGSETGGGQNSSVGVGNFQLARLGGSGADVVRENLAGGYGECVLPGATVPTQPGNDTGPAATGINVRLGINAGAVKKAGYLPDVITEVQGSDLEYDPDTGNITLDNGKTIVTDASDLDFSYDSTPDSYTSRIESMSYNFTPPLGAFDRRNLAVVIANCDGKNTGQSDLPILGLGCFFLLQEAKQQGVEAEIYGEFVEECDANGSFGPFPPTTNVGPTKIILYNDIDKVGS
jgi:hypothetical protein